MRVIDLDGGGVDVVVDEEMERDGRGLRVPMRFTVSPTRMSVYAQSSWRLAVKRSSPEAIFAVKVCPVSIISGCENEGKNRLTF